MSRPMNAIETPPTSQALDLHPESRFDVLPPILHPAMEFTPTWASLGIVSPTREALIVPAQGAVLNAKTEHGANRVDPAPLSYPNIPGRWASDDLKDFLADRHAPSLGLVIEGTRRVFDAHLELPAEMLTTLAVWTTGTYFYRLFTTYPRVAATGERGSGKSKLLSLIAYLAFNGLLYVTPTAAVIYRLIEPLRPTLCLDEMEGLAGDDQRAITAILNAGYKLGGSVPRCEGEGADRHVVSYDVYAPIAVGSINGVNMVLADRTIPVVMERGRDPEKINREVHPTDPRFQELRAALYRMALMQSFDLRRLLACKSPDLPDWLNGRSRELFRPLLALAALAATEPAAGSRDVRKDLLHVAGHLVESRESLPEEGRELFYVLEERLARDAEIICYPMQLVEPLSYQLYPAEAVNRGKHIPARTIGALLTRYGFCGKPTNKGTRYCISRQEFKDRAGRAGYPFTLP